MKARHFLAVLVSSMILCSSALADVIYENGDFNGTFDGAQISPPQSVSNSFTVGQNALITSATVGLWSPAGSEPLMLTWSIGETRFGTERGTGTVVLTGSNDPQFFYDDFYVYLSTFALNVSLEPRDYFFTLSNGSSTGNLWLGWDINFGPSTVYFRNLQGESQGTDSEYFRLDGTFIAEPNPVSEPTSLVIMAIGTIAFRLSRRKKNIH